MGAEMSKQPDPCAGQMESYIKCVEARTAESGGLRDGDECEQESQAYRDCRQKVKELRNAVKK